MIPAAYIREWGNHVPWQETNMIEQDLIICRSLVEIFQDPYLAENMAFRGGTAIHKLYLYQQPRFSDDIDLVARLLAGPNGEMSDHVEPGFPAGTYMVLGPEKLHSPKANC